VSAADYNRPPAVIPREDMWAAIQAARSAGVTPMSAAPSVADPKVIPFARRGWVRTAAALAATLVLGISLGRISKPSVENGVEQPVQNAVRQTDSVPGSASGPLAQPVETTIAAVDPSPRSGSTTRPPNEVRQTGSGRLPAPNPNERDRVLNAPLGSSSAAYQLVTQQYMKQTEALLVSYRGDAKNQVMDATIGKWAKDLLSSTRLLLDSPAASDPQRRQLLEDLELVLVQIVRLTPRSSTEERDLIDNTLKDADVLSRLRTAIPAGAMSSSGT
jgi:hypothetical protein